MDSSNRWLDGVEHYVRARDIWALLLITGSFIINSKCSTAFPELT